MSEHVKSVTMSVGDRGIAAWEVASVFTSVLIAEWIMAVAGINKYIVAVPVIFAFGLMVASHYQRDETLRDIGFRFDNFARAILLLLIPMLLVTAAFLIIGRLSGSGIKFSRWATDRPLLLQLALGVLWGLLQQYVLQGFVNRRAMIVLGRGWKSILLVALIFAALHLPNLWLAAITFVGGGVWAAVYQRRPNLFALAVSHSLMTWVVISTFPPLALHHLRIGFGYFL